MALGERRSRNSPWTLQKYKIKEKATSIKKIQQVLCSFSLNNVGKYLRYGPFQYDIGIVNLHPTKGTHWVCYTSENYFDSNGCVCPKKLSKIIIKRKRNILYAEYKIQALTKKRVFYCASYCFYKIYLINI